MALKCEDPAEHLLYPIRTFLFYAAFPRGSTCFRNLLGLVVPALRLPLPDSRAQGGPYRGTALEIVATTGCAIREFTLHLAARSRSLLLGEWFSVHRWRDPTMTSFSPTPFTRVTICDQPWLQQLRAATIFLFTSFTSPQSLNLPP